MTLRLGDLDACFEGAIPSIVATTAADGAPNVSYLSQVTRIDDDHVALSNQFFGKTAANLRANPQAAILLVDARTGRQVRLDAVHEGSVTAGEAFDRVAAHLAATSAQVGMTGIMRLRALDVFHVVSISAVPSAASANDTPLGASPAAPSLGAVAAVAAAIAQAEDVGAVVDAILDGLTQSLGYNAAIAFLHDKPRDVLLTLDSRGTPQQGAGSEVPFGQGVAGTAAVERRLVKVSDLSRVRRFGAAIRASGEGEDRARSIPLPGLFEALSQMAAPLVAQGVLHGVVVVESTRAMAFDADDEATLLLLASQAAVALALAEASAAEPSSDFVAKALIPPARQFRVVHYPFDDSVFIEAAYIIKGVAGRLLMFLLERHLAEGRTEFTNREIRLTEALRLPDLKDNLETRLLLLRRRLDERGAPVRLTKAGRGRIHLALEGRPHLERGT